MRLTGLAFAVAAWCAPLTALAAAPDPAPPPVTRSDEASIRAWAADHLEQDGWIFYGFTTPDGATVLWLVADHSATGSKYPILQEWVRSESALAPGSRLARTELDCSKRQMRELDQIIYQGNNLRGPITSAHAIPDAAWVPIVKGSVAQSLMERVCRDAD